jgi:hypothetical protein
MRPSLLQHPREFQAPVAGVPTTPTGYHQWHRSLAAELGRFGSRDPVGYRARCINLCEYAFDMPSNRTDASGLQAGPIQPPGGRWPFPEPPRPAPTPPPGPAAAPDAGPGYGKYCGPRSSNKPPDDGLDTACKIHDECMASPIDFCKPFKRRLCDVALCLRASWYLCDDAKDRAECIKWRATIIAIMCNGGGPIGDTLPHCGGTIPCAPYPW